MGYGSFEHTAYEARGASLRSAGYTSNFVHHEDIQAGRAQAGCHDLMNVLHKSRESRDSAEHPTSKAVFVGFDVTGSMQTIPRLFQERLSPLMTMLGQSDYIAGPQVLISAIGDVFSDKAPFQCGQFESNNTIDADLGRLYLEGQGGPGIEESYELAAFMMAHRTSTDCWEKRQERGYAFLFGDELSYDTLYGSTIAKVFGSIGGENFQDMDVQELFQAAREKYDLFFVIPSGTAHYNDARILSHWQRRVGTNRALKLSDPTAVSGLIASAIAFAEGCSHDEIREHLAATSLPGGAYTKTQIDSVISAIGAMGAQDPAAVTRRGERRAIIRNPESTTA
jgi:hypothetical protein